MANHSAAEALIHLYDSFCGRCGSTSHTHSNSRLCPRNAINQKKLWWEPWMINDCTITHKIFAGFFDADGSFTEHGTWIEACIQQSHQCGHDVLAALQRVYGA